MSSDHLTTQRFRAWCRKMRRLCPTDAPVSIRRVKRVDKGDSSGLCIEYEDEDTGERSYEIRIRKGLSRGTTWDTLAHEWAHVLRDEDPTPLSDPEGHDNTFWLIHGQIYRAWDKVK